MKRKLLLIINIPLAALNHYMAINYFVKVLDLTK